MTNTALDPRLGLAELTGPDAVGMQPAIAGHPIKLVADDLCISVRTVEVHRARIFEKENVTSAVALANPLRQAGVGAGEGSDGR